MKKRFHKSKPVCGVTFDLDRSREYPCRDLIDGRRRENDREAGQCMTSAESITHARQLTGCRYDIPHQYGPHDVQLMPYTEADRRPPDACVLLLRCCRDDVAVVVFPARHETVIHD